MAPRYVARRLATLGLLVGIALGGTAAEARQDPPPEANPQIEQIQKQIQELQKQLDALKQPAAAPAAPAVASPVLDAWIKGLAWRSIGPANMGGRIVALSVFEADPNLFYVATASSGLLKTENNGVTFEHLFDREATVSIGDVCVAPSDRNIVWVGTGEHNPRNSVSYGDGVYKSTDGGKTWTNMGLKDSYQIGRIVVHPINPDIVYVGALGRLWGPSAERGVYKTTDGGKTWNRVLFVDDKTGVIELQMHPAEPDTLIAATYERLRGPYDVGDPDVKHGAGAGLHRTTDGGATWTKLTAGLPTVSLGRIGVSYYRKDPKIVYAIVDSEKIGTGPPRPPGTGTAYMGIRGETAEEKAVLTTVTEDGPAAKAGLLVGDILVAIGDRPLKGYEDLVEQLSERKPEDKLSLKILREDKEQVVEVTLAKRPEGSGGGGGGDPDRPFGGMLSGQRENVQDRQGDDGFQTGGVYRSDNGGESWTRVNSLNPRPMYFSQIRVDPADEQKVYVLGIALYRSSDGGKTFKGDGGRNVHADHHALWIDPRDGRHMVLGCDGGVYLTYDRMERWDHLNHMALGQFYHVAIDPRRDYRAFGGLQDNGTWGGPTRRHDGSGPLNEDWLSINGGDGFQCQVDPEDPDVVYATSQYGGLVRRNLRTGESASIRPRPPEGKSLRWNWNTPFILSSRNPRIYYCAGNFVYRSVNRGADPKAISPEITRTDKGSATALAESPRNPDVLYVGTDDGAFWVTRDGGANWTDIAKNVGLPGAFHVATIEASRFADGRAYVAFDAHRSNDDAAYFYVTEDFGATWTRLGPDLPRGSAHCLREDRTGENLLYAGTEFAIWVSIDRGKTFNRLNANLPTVAVHEIAVHPTAGEIVAATHGRSLWVLDVSALRQIKPETLTAKATLFDPVSALRRQRDPRRGGTNRRFVGENPSSGAAIHYALGQKAESVSLNVIDPEGKAIRPLRTSREPGLHRVVWDTTRPVQREGATRAGGSASAMLEAIRMRAMENIPGRPVPTGVYRIELKVDGETFTRTVRVEPDPTLPADVRAALEAQTGESTVDEADEAPAGPILD